jgi:DNA-binding transcriptional LysR family regulator
VRQLEARLGAALFVRHARGARCTSRPCAASRWRG